MSGPVKYCINPLAPFPKRWFDHIGNVTVMCEPAKGYLMVRRPGGVPFVLHVAQILNAEKHPHHGPFTVIEGTRRRVGGPLTSGASSQAADSAGGNTGGRE